MIPKYNKRDGHDVSVVTSIFVDSTKKVGYEKVNPGRYYLQDGIEVIRIPFKRIILNSIAEKLRLYEGLYILLEEKKPDLIFMHGIQFLDIKTVIKYIKANPNCTLVADNHASYYNSGKNFISREILHKIIHKKTIQKALPNIEKIYQLAPGCKDFAINMYNIPEEKMEYLYLGADTEKIDFIMKEDTKAKVRKELKINDDDFVFITGGKLSKGKNIKSLLISLKKIHSEKIKLIIFGAFSDDIREEMNDLISKDDRVRYIGWLRGDEVYDYYLASDAAIFPGTKSALWEQAICSGLPLVCRRWPGMEYVDVGGNVLFVENDINEFIEKIELLATDKEIYEEMKYVACTKGFDTFSYERIARQAISINK
ncbi:Glycosyltransferase involved in cell wall bisynthesis [Proteiniclasticum ruminis]|uniref:Glycosyltransferase involved in cell wall bisynthesis n=2 Tax=Proteiniclasticum ruminis TaxID=398199 RepID=A0A1I5A782_9CLOT|nr:Glycosyltransferase involved in cell wall bisynthesis [Proteiniclasticum ruminis]